MVKSKIGTKEYEEKVLNEIRSAYPPLCSASYVAKRLNIGFATARGLLMELVIKGKLERVETTFGQCYQIPKKSKEDESGKEKKL